LDGHCSFPDPSCTLTGQRYGDLSGPLSGTCVGENPPIDTPMTGGEMGTTDAQCTFGGFDECDLTPSQPFNITTNTTLDTGSDPLCHVRPQSGGADACLVYTTSATIAPGATLTVIGTRPF